MVKETSDRGFVFVGSSDSNDGDVNGNKGGRDVWAVKVDSIGNAQWKRTVGGSADEVAYDVFQNASGEYMISGYTQSNDGDVSGNHGGMDIWAVKLSH
jgi:hypothetical protein